ncbi:MAG: hypothetical protein MRERC_4c064 [Mycoplasmataceae bacterium RC_NB112A]|nr:MAG: hypothetical protein MRERC_4c064 [Mycoplasmataceae bacterium RC_NB112A]
MRERTRTNWVRSSFQADWKNIPLTFRKFFYQIFPHDIKKFALQNLEKLPGLVAEIRDKIQKECSNWVDLVCGKQVGNLICQVENYSSKAKIFKNFSEFQNIPLVIHWIIYTNTKLCY